MMSKWLLYFLVVASVHAVACPSPAFPKGIRLDPYNRILFERNEITLDGVSRSTLSIGGSSSKIISAHYEKYENAIYVMTENSTFKLLGTAAHLLREHTQHLAHVAHISSSRGIFVLNENSGSSVFLQQGNASKQLFSVKNTICDIDVSFRGTGVFLTRDNQVHLFVSGQEKTYPMAVFINPDKVYKSIAINKFGNAIFAVTSSDVIRVELLANDDIVVSERKITSRHVVVKDISSGELLIEKI